VTGEKKTAEQHLVRWNVPSGQMVSGWLLQVKRNGKWETKFYPATTKSEMVSMKNVSAVTVTAVSRFRNLSPPAQYVP
jgi:hypothetical protein